MEKGSVLYAFTLSLLAGLSTAFGAVIVFFSKTDNKKFLSAALGFSAGVMIYISFMEMLPTAIEYLSLDMEEKKANIIVTSVFFLSMTLIGIISHLVPDDDFHDARSTEEMRKEANDKKLKSTGMKSAIALAAHNFPEGMATFMSSLINPELGVSIAIAVAIHNIPEGVGIAAPLYFSTGDKKKAFWATFWSGFSEPIGALCCYLFLMPFINNFVFGIVFSIISGIMVLISFDELLPASRAYNEPHLSLIGLILGMGIMAISLIAF